MPDVRNLRMSSSLVLSGAMLFCGLVSGSRCTSPTSVSKTFAVGHVSW